MGSLNLKQIDAAFAEVTRPAVVVTHRLAGNVRRRLDAAIRFPFSEVSADGNLTLIAFGHE